MAMHPEATHQMQESPSAPLFPKKIMIVAGEASGDLHGANLVKAMKGLDPSIRFYGIGSNRMREAGVELMADAADMAVVGLTEVFSKLGIIFKARNQLKAFLREAKPDLVILIDYPDFNIPLAKEAKGQGIKVLYYISPQVWAWRKGRIQQLKELVDQMAVILPFEADLYREAGMEVAFVGHPLLDVVRTKYTRHEALNKFNLQVGRRTVALLPGSRQGELTRLLPEMLGAAVLMAQKDPTLQFVLPLADTLDPAPVSDLISRCPVQVRMVVHDTYDAIAISDMAIVASGTATLETALLGIPMVIVYRVSAFSYLVGRIVIQIDRIGLVNIIADKMVVPELVQKEANPGRIACEAMDILTNDERAGIMKAELAEIRKKLGGPGAAGKTARLACDMLQAIR